MGPASGQFAFEQSPRLTKFRDAVPPRPRLGFHGADNASASTFAVTFAVAKCDTRDRARRHGTAGPPRTYVGGPRVSDERVSLTHAAVGGREFRSLATALSPCQPGSRRSRRRLSAKKLIPPARQSASPRPMIESIPSGSANLGLRDMS